MRLGRVLSKEFPNPERIGCPSRDLLKALAARQLSLTEAEPWMDHFAQCTPCFRDYTELRRLVERRRKLSYLGVAAVVIVACAIGWGWYSRRQGVITAHNYIVADMRNRLCFAATKGPARARSCSSVDLTTFRSTFRKGAKPAIMTSRFSTKSPQSRS